MNNGDGGVDSERSKSVDGDNAVMIVMMMVVMVTIVIMSGDGTGEMLPSCKKSNTRF
jgi:hypothetical protein